MDFSRRTFSKLAGSGAIAVFAFGKSSVSAKGMNRQMTVDREMLTDPATNLKIAVSRARPAYRRSPVPVIYVHGGTFSSELSLGYRFDGVSWRDQLLQAGHEVWAFDFLGFGASDRFRAMEAPPIGVEPLGRTPEAAAQLRTVVDHVRLITGQTRVSLIAHSWGTMVAGRFAGERSDQVARIVFFAPIVERQLAMISADAPSPPALPPVPAWMRMTLAAQFKRFTDDVPSNHAAVLSQAQFEKWGADYLATDPTGRLETPPSVHIPLGPVADIGAAWHGRLPYDPALITAPLRIVRGEWDTLSNDADAAWLLGNIGSGSKSDTKLPAGTHLMHLEDGRARVYAAAESWLASAS